MKCSKTQRVENIGKQLDVGWKYHNIWKYQIYVRKRGYP